MKKGVYSVECPVTSKTSFLNIRPDSGKVWVRNTVLHIWFRNGKSLCTTVKHLQLFLPIYQKAFDCLSLSVIIGKLNAYGFTLSSSKLIHSHSPNRKQKTNINSALGLGKKFSLVRPQASIIGLALLSIFICDLFSILSNIDFTKPMILHHMLLEMV